ncbi:MAG: hypothetical protein K5695_04750 [Oscillospiraceae bacterium]|nr:hypothetical protein [Oscillospiraceae bacterium]
MKQPFNLEFLKQADEVTEERIANEFPFPLVHEDLFERAYQNYIGQPETAPAAPIRHHRMLLISTAACFLIVLGAALAFRIPSHQIPTLPDGGAAGTAADTQPSESTVTETNTESDSDPGALAVVATDPTAPPDIPQESDATEASHVTEPPTEAEVRTEAAPIATDAPAQITEPAVIPPTELVTEEPTEAATAVIEQELDGFVVLNDDGRRMIRCTDAFPEPTGELQEYRIEGELVWLLDCWDDVTEDGRPIRYYKIECWGEIFTVTQQEYASFSLEIPDNTSVMEITTNRTHGFRLPDEWECTVYWFEDGEGFCVKGESASKMDRIARSFIPVESAGS